VIVVRRIAASLLGVLLAFVMLEAVLRVTGPGWVAARLSPDDAQFDDSEIEGDGAWPGVWREGVWRSFEPGATLRMSNPEYRALAHVDRWGGRVTNGSLSTPPRVVFLGDSQLFGVGVNDDETFATLLSRRLNRAVANLGVPGSGPPAQVQLLSLRHGELGDPPVYVFWFYAGNDLSDLIYETSEGDPAARPGKYAGVYALGDHMVRTRFVRGLYVVRLGGAAVRAWMNEQPFAETDGFFFLGAPGREAFRDQARAILDMQIQAIDALSHELHFRAAFVLIPDRLQLYPDVRAERVAHYKLDAPLAVDLPNVLLRSALARYAMPLIDPLDCLRAQGEGLYYRETHLTAAGHRAVAACVAEPLRAFLDQS
jgi:hypothetical protein